eukprot:1181761-Prorocentrum_minimum.AAC.1
MAKSIRERGILKRSEGSRHVGGSAPAAAVGALRTRCMSHPPTLAPNHAGVFVAPPGCVVVRRSPSSLRA